MDGILLVNKEKGLTSRDVVDKVGKLLNTKKVGHCGTLDPLATGLLVLGVFDGLKIIQMINTDTKEYIGQAKFGLSTDTLDITGNVLKKVDNYKIDKETLLNALLSFKGSYMQEVPLFSSVKVNGERLYKYAREGKSVTLPKREVNIYDIKLLDFNCEYFSFKCVVSKGTYIRSLIRDIGNKINIPCVMSDLKRTKQGKFNIEDSYFLKDIENKKFKIIPIATALSNYKQIVVDKDKEKEIQNGKILNNIYNEDIIVFKNNERVLAIYEKYNKDDTKIKPIRVFK